jgi:hypothetical protein
MYKFLILLLLTACTNTKVVNIIPEPPKELMVPPESLQLIGNERKLSEITYVIINNYMTYHKESEKLQKLQEWIKEQKNVKF